MVTEEVKTLSIRNVGQEAQRLARAAAALDRVPLGAWLTSAIMARIKQERPELVG